jgi:hypothetical protein
VQPIASVIREQPYVSIECGCQRPACQRSVGCIERRYDGRTLSRSTVDKLPSGRFRARYKSPNGRWVSKSFDRREDARRWLRYELRKADQGDWTDPRIRHTPLGEWAEQ